MYFKLLLAFVYFIRLFHIHNEKMTKMMISCSTLQDKYFINKTN